MVAWSDKTLYGRIIDRWSEKESDYSKINVNRDIITNYFRSDELIEVDDRGNLIGENIYNAAGPWYSRLMATGFQGSLVSKNISWIRYQMDQYELRGVDQLDTWVQDIKEYMSYVYQRSNFYDIQPQFTLDGLTTGSPVLFAEESIAKNKIIWKPQHYKTVRLFYDSDNEIDGVIVKDKHWTAKQIFDVFIGDDDDKGSKRKDILTLEVNRALEAGKLNDEFTIYRAVFRVNDPIWDSKTFKKPSGKWTWLSVYFQELSDSDQSKKNKPLNKNIGYFSRPFATWEFDKKPWEVSSRTPAFYAIWDCMGLQQVYKNFMENIQLKNRPPRIALDTMKNRLALSPEGEMYVTQLEYDRPPRSLDMVGDVTLTKELSDLYDDALKRWFYIDRFQMFTDLTMRNKQPVSATQIWQMAGEKASLLSPAIETHSKYLKDCDARMVSIEIQAGRGPFAKDIMDNITDIVLSNVKTPISSIGVVPVFIGPLVQAQKASQALEPILSGLTAARGSGLFDIDPDLVHAIRGYETLNDILEAGDFPQRNIVPKDEYDEIKAQLAQSRAQQAEFENALAAAKASKDVSGAVDPNSILGSIAEVGINE